MASNPSNPQTLDQLAVASGSKAYLRFVEAIFKSGSLLPIFSFKPDDRLTASAYGIEEDGLPTLAWGSINEEATDVKTNSKARSGWMSLVRHTLSCDRKLQRAWKAQGQIGPGQWEIQVKGFTTAWARKFSGDLINGATETDGDPDPKGFVGFRNMMASKATYHLTSACDIDASVNLSPGSVSGGTVSAFEAKLHQMLYRMDNPTGKGVKLLAGVELMQQIASGQRVGKYFDTTKDYFGRTVTTWKDAEFHIAGIDSAGADILPGYETAAGVIGTDGTNKYASLFAVQTDPMALHTWMAGSLEPEDLPRNNVWDQKLIDAGFGFLPLNNFWLGRLYDIQVRD